MCVLDRAGNWVFASTALVVLVSSMAGHVSGQLCTVIMI